MMAMAPALLLFLVSFAMTTPEVRYALMAAAGFSAVIAALSMFMLRLTAPKGASAVLAGVVGGMLLRLVALAVFCFFMSLMPEVHLTVACLAATASLVAALIIDSAGIARSLSVRSVETASEVPSV
jgi:hypothetical protein